MHSGIILPINENSQVGEARRLAQARVDRLGFDETSRGRVALLVNEAGYNLVKHAGGGELILQNIERAGEIGFELISLDRGPGMQNVATCLQDGFSTSGTLGSGLGALSRISDEFEIYSEFGSGVVLLARLWSPSKPASLERDEIGSIALPYPGEEVSGDGWFGFSSDRASLYMLADGLGHGPEAALASAEAIKILDEHRIFQPKALLERLHLGLKKTRGAAVAIAVIDHEQGQLTFAGVGNIAGKIVNNEGFQGLVSHDGTAGYLQAKIQEYVYPWSSNSILIMHSDGISSRSFPPLGSILAAQNPSLIAGLLLRDCKRARDDQTVLVVKGRH